MKRTWLLWGLAAGVFTVLNLSLLVGNLSSSDPAWPIQPWVEVMTATAYLTTAIVGSLILSCHPRHRIGWICGIAGTAAAFAALASEYQAATLPLPGQQAVAWLGDWLWWTASGAGATFLILLFPDGHLPSARWRPVAWAAAGSLAVVGLTHAFAPGPLDAEFRAFVNPVGVDIAGGVIGTVRDLAWMLVAGTFLAALVALVSRIRVARGERRQQLKWLAYAGSLPVVALPVWAYAVATGRPAPVLGQLVIGVAIVAIPVATGIAILKYRLYEIDLVINKTLVVGALAVSITALYGGVVAGIGALAGSVGDLPASFVATAVVAVAFQPVRQRVQRLANQVVYGQRVSPYEAITGFSARMSQALSPQEILPGMAEAAAKGVGGDRGRVRVFLGGGGAREVTWPAQCREPFDHAVAVVHQGVAEGDIAVGKRRGDAITERDAALVAALAVEAGPVLRNLRLAEELQLRLRELQESRQRIVTAQDRERRRVERDIHDGAQQSLVSMSAKLGLARRLLVLDPPKAETLLDELGEDISETVDHLRDLARGVFPPLLTERGLLAALEMHLLKIRQPARLVTRGAAATARFAPETEAALYFCAVEALQNASKHAPGADIEVRVAYENGSVELSVTDSGPGFDPETASGGCGLQNMADRLAAIGGELEVVTAPGGPTRVRGRVPAQLRAPAPEAQPA